MDIIEFIVTEQKKKSVEIETVRLESIPELDEQSIFKDNNQKGLLNKNKFKEVFTKSHLDLVPIKDFFDRISEQQKIATTPFPQTSRKGDKYYWIKQNGKFGGTEYKLPHFDGLDEIMSAYIFGIYRFKIDFKTLYEEAIR